MQVQSAQIDLRKELRALLALAIPVILSELGWMSMSIVDTIMVGRLSAEAIGAVGVGNAIYYAPALFGIGILLGLDTLVSQAYGRGDFDECHRWLALARRIHRNRIHACINAVFVGRTTGISLSENQSCGESANIGLSAHAQLGHAALAALRRLPPLPARSETRCAHHLRAHLRKPHQLAGNWVLIYGHFGFPAMGVRGSALSTCMARTYMAGVLILAAWKNEADRGHPLFAHWPGIVFHRIAALMKLGVPAAVQIVMEVGAFGAATVMIGRLAPAALAAHQIALTVPAFSYMVPLGTSAAAAVSVGHAVGAGNGPRARRAGWLALAIGVWFHGLRCRGFSSCAACCSHRLHKSGSCSADGSAIARPGCRLSDLRWHPDNLHWSTARTRRNARADAGKLCRVLALWTPARYVLCFWRGQGVFGIWIGLTLALIFIASILLFQWWRDSSRLVSHGLPEPVMNFRTCGDGSQFLLRSRSEE